MRVELYAPKGVVSDQVSHDLLTMLRHHLSQMPDVKVTTDAPDIIHIFGAWNYHSARHLFKAHRLRIPTVWSPLGGLCEWVTADKPTEKQLKALAYQRKMLRLADTVHVMSTIEHMEVAKYKDSKGIALIPNAIITNQISEEEMARQLAACYQQTISLYDKRIRSEIETFLGESGVSCKAEEEQIIKICRQTLYIDYYRHRNTIPLSLLNQLSHTLTTSDYNEDALVDTHRRLKQMPLFQSLLQVMAERCALTEGFMPDTPADNRLTKTIRKLICEDT